MDAPQTQNVPSQKFVLTEIVLMPVLLIIHVLLMLNATPPIISQPVDVLQDWRATPMSTVSEWSVESTKTVPRTLLASQTSVPTLVCMRTHVHHQLPAQFRIMLPSAHVHQAGLVTHWCPVHPNWHQMCQNQTQSVSQMETVQMTLPVSTRDVRTHVTHCHHVMSPRSAQWRTPYHSEP